MCIRDRHNIGLACVFRQPNADHSHCHLLHGYSLQFKFTFGCDNLDNKNWAVDFGGLKELKEWLKYMFDHTYLVATDDPEFQTFVDLSNKNIIDLREVSSTGCERFAELTFNEASRIIEAQYGDRCWVESVTVREHEHNSATVRRIDA